jgi:hypothetical protein
MREDMALLGGVRKAGSITTEPDMDERLRWSAWWRAGGYALVALVVWLSLAPRPPELAMDHGDKVQHLLAYGGLMLWFGQLYAGRARRVAALALVALGIALEALQGLTGYRSVDAFDMGANAAGVLLGAAAAPPRLPNVFRLLERLVG